MTKFRDKTKYKHFEPKTEFVEKIYRLSTDDTLQTCPNTIKIPSMCIYDPIDQLKLIKNQLNREPVIISIQY